MERTTTVKSALATALALALTACGGGGGGGNVRIDTPPPPPPPTTPPPTPPPPAKPQEPAFDAHLSVTNARAAQAAGLSGQNVRIGIVDSGVQRDAVALNGRVVANLNYIDPSRNNLQVDDVVGHGTAVASLAAGAPVGSWPGGIAPGAQIVSARIIADKPPADDGSGKGNSFSGPLGVAQVQRPSDVRGRLDDRERRQVRIGRRARAVRREHIGGQPALVDRALDLARRVGLRQLRHPGQTRSLPARPRARKRRRPLVQRTNGSWYHLLVRCRRRVAHRARRDPAPSSTRYRASPVAARERPSRRRSHAARTIPRSLRGQARRYSSRSSP